MAVVESYIMSAGASGEATGRRKGDESSTFRVRWFARCDSPTDTPVTVLDHFRRTSGRPYIGSTYEAGSDSERDVICTSITPTLIEKSGGMFYVDVSYSPSDDGKNEDKPGKDNPGKTTTDPREWHDEVDVSYTQVSIPAERALFHGFKRGGDGRGGDPVDTYMKPGKFYTPKASNLYPFDPTFEYEVDIKIVRFTKYAAEFDGSGSNKWIGVVNSDDVTIRKPFCRYIDHWGKQTARIKGLPSTFGIINGIPHWRIGAEVHVSPLGWRRLILDRGAYVRQMPGNRELMADGSWGTPISASVTGQPWKLPLDENGYASNEPRNLNGHGEPIDPDKEDEVWGIWQAYEERSFAGIRW